MAEYLDPDERRLRAERERRPQFPRVRVSVDGKESFVTFDEAGRLQDSLSRRVTVRDDVLESDMTVRPITAEEVAKINAVTDEWGAKR